MCQLLPDSQLLRQVNGSVSAGGEFWPFTNVYFLNECFRDLDWIVGQWDLAREQGVYWKI